MGFLLRLRAAVVILTFTLSLAGCTGFGVRERTWAPQPDTPANETVASKAGRARILTASATASATAFSTASAAAHVAPAVDSLGVMTFNMKHKNRPSELAAIARSLKADLPRTPEILLCQEVVFGRDAADDHTATLLAKHFGYYSRGTKRTSDSEGVAIVSKYPFTYYAERHLDAQTSSLLLGFRRVSVMGEFDVPGVGRVRAVNVHFTNWGFEKRIRRKQIEETLQWIARREKQAPAAITFFGGDFNAERDWSEMQWLKRPEAHHGLAFRDFNTETPSFGGPGSPRIRIDFVFVASPSVGLHLQEERVLWKDGLRKKDGDHFHPSDHLAVVHRYALATPANVTASLDGASALE